MTGYPVMIIFKLNVMDDVKHDWILIPIHYPSNESFNTHPPPVWSTRSWMIWMDDEVDEVVDEVVDDYHMNTYSLSP